jgi:hypothetical protein
MEEYLFAIESHDLALAIDDIISEFDLFEHSASIVRCSHRQEQLRTTCRLILAGQPEI